MSREQATIRNEYGIHCRPSAVIAREAQAYAGTIEVWREGADSKIDAKSILMIVGLGIRCGETVTIAVTGPDEASMCQRMVELFETDYDFSKDA